jgi:hypothetical protein
MDGEAVTFVEEPAPMARHIVLCENIFRITDMSMTRVYLDIDKCLFQDEDDALDIINYDYSRRTFLVSQKPVFLQKIREMNGTIKGGEIH